MELPPFHGLVWFHGKSKPTPVYAPPYWTIPACKRLARPDPYHDEHAGDDAALPPYEPQPSSPLPLLPGPASRAKRGPRKGVIAAALIAMLGAGVWLFNNTGAAPAWYDPSSPGVGVPHHQAPQGVRPGLPQRRR